MAVALDPPAGDHEYVYGDVPPVTDVEAIPLLLPKQVAGVTV